MEMFLFNHGERNMLMNKISKKQKGFSLVELLAVVGIGGALIAGALLLVSDVQSKREIKQHSEAISTIYTNMTTLFSDESMSGVNTSDLVTAGVFPSTLKINTGASDPVKTSGGGVVAINATSSGDGFTLNYNKIKAAACVEVIRNQRRVGWDNWGVTGGDNDASANQSFADTSITTITSACSTASDNNDWVSLVFDIQ